MQKTVLFRSKFKILNFLFLFTGRRDAVVDDTGRLADAVEDDPGSLLNTVDESAWNKFRASF
jgi:hypothetical protein